MYIHLVPHQHNASRHSVTIAAVISAVTLYNHLQPQGDAVRSQRRNNEGPKRAEYTANKTSTWMQDTSRCYNSRTVEHATNDMNHTSTVLCACMGQGCPTNRGKTHEKSTKKLKKYKGNLASLFARFFRSTRCCFYCHSKYHSSIQLQCFQI